MQLAGVDGENLLRVAMKADHGEAVTALFKAGACFQSGARTIWLTALLDSRSESVREALVAGGAFFLDKVCAMWCAVELVG